jgi:hypothetical protein
LSLSIFDYFCDQMRIIVFFISLFFLLLNGEQPSYASTQGKKTNYSSNQTSFQTKQIQFSSDNRNLTLFDETDLNLEEEYQHNDDFEKSPENKFVTTKHNSFNGLYDSKSDQILLNYYKKHHQIFHSLCGNSSPIYISQRVLRI